MCPLVCWKVSPIIADTTHLDRAPYPRCLPDGAFAMTEEAWLEAIEEQRRQEVAKGAAAAKAEATALAEEAAEEVAELTAAGSLHGSGQPTGAATGSQVADVAVVAADWNTDRGARLAMHRHAYATASMRIISDYALSCPIAHAARRLASLARRARREVIAARDPTAVALGELAPPSAGRAASWQRLSTSLCFALIGDAASIS